MEVRLSTVLGNGIRKDLNANRVVHLHSEEGHIVPKMAFSCTIHTTNGCFVYATEGT